MAVVGDFEPTEAKAWVQKYFGGIPAVAQPPKPDLTEPRQEKEQRFTKDDKLATKPALAFAYHMPERNTPSITPSSCSTRFCCRAKTPASTRLWCRSAASPTT
ncbi:insulinase family protein [Hymenobacter sp. 5516J-16]|uniref:insulinase family protein n=1 Tax=Hymenobacter sp. 5516J-16 TaxID=2932253 RepID=UPI001FD5B98C|nr:insulinase family protein [Hymenobacter sp. 5516J-16]UOQ79121.1 insulinase family protein [Hymenobacter sp. 5516J-16]